MNPVSIVTSLTSDEAFIHVHDSTHECDVFGHEFVVGAKRGTSWFKIARRTGILSQDISRAPLTA
jgi:hypothetical protein